LPDGVVATLPSGAGFREEGVAFKSEEPAQEWQKPLPVLPTPTQEPSNELAEPVAEPKAAKPRKAGAARGKAKSANAKTVNAKRKEPKAAAAKAKEPKVKGH